MAILPLLVNLAREMDEPRTICMENYWDDDFGFGIHPVDIFRRQRLTHAPLLHPRRRYAPYDRSNSMLKFGKLMQDGESPNVGKDGFQVCVDVSQFKPNELNVKTVDNTVIIEGKHEEREDDYGHGMIQRSFVRKYSLPKGYDPKEVVSTISSDGVLSVKAPLPASKAIKHNERVVQIQQTGPAHLSVKAPDQQQQQQQEQQQETSKLDRAMNNHASERVKAK